MWWISSFHFHSCLEDTKPLIYKNNELDLFVGFFSPCVHWVLIAKEFQDNSRMVVLCPATQHRSVRRGSPGVDSVHLPIGPQTGTSWLSLQFLCLDFVFAVPLFLYPFRASGKERRNWRWGSGMWVEDLAGTLSVTHFLSCLPYSGHLFSLCSSSSRVNAGSNCTLGQGHSLCRRVLSSPFCGLRSRDFRVTFPGYTVFAVGRPEILSEAWAIILLHKKHTTQSNTFMLQMKCYGISFYKNLKSNT